MSALPKKVLREMIAEGNLKVAGDLHFSIFPFDYQK
jgi:hypothetical protein